jgi:hypothetical protein
MHIAVLIDPLDTNGFVVANSSGATANDAVSSLKEKTLGKSFTNMDIGRITLDEDVWDELRSEYDGDLIGQNMSGFVLETFELDVPS